MGRQPSGTVTFLFTDIEGSTRLLTELGTRRYSEALDAHRRLLRATFERHHGYEVDHEGDAFMVAFQSAHEAVVAAAEAQRALSEHAWPGGHELRVRIGVHTGEPEVAPPKYVGIDVHRAARIAAAGHGGQVLLSQSTRDLVQTDDSRDLGEHRLKDLAAPERIWQLGDAEFPPLKSLYQTNLPVPATPFVGRERELAEASELIFGGLRLLTLSGPGGTGKTRLALQVAAAVGDGYPDGIWWVPLAPLGDPALVLPTVGEALHAKGDLAAHIAGRRLIVLLDNFEHVIDAAGGVGALVAACPHLTVLVTSRERLGVAGEHEYAVPTLTPSEGFELFSARTRALGTEIAEDQARRELCERLDNLPLALELAAARTKLFSPTQLLERLGQRLDLFKGGRDADPRQRTLRATIDWSYDLLTPEEQLLFARLSVFAGGCTYEAAELICGADEDTLQSLLDKSLVRRRQGFGGEPRYWMLETIREFAAERLTQLSQSESLAGRHASWFCELALRLEKPVRYGDPVATARVTAELDNMRAGLEWLAQHGEIGQAVRIIDALWYFWITRGSVTEGLRWAHWAVAEAPKASPDECALALIDASELFRFFGDRDQALRIKRGLLPELRELSPDRHFPATLSDTADMLAEAGEFDEARRLGGDAVAWRRRLGAPTGIGHALANLGMVEFRAGDFARARALNEEALTFFEEPYVPTMIAGAALLAGESARREGDGARARHHLLRALRLSQELGQRGTFPELLQEIAAAGSGGPSDAVRLLGASERLLTEMGVPRWDPSDSGRTIATLRTELGDDAFTHAWAEGLELTEDEALALAAKYLD